MIPTVGRIVHYRHLDSEATLAAIIVRVEPAARPHGFPRNEADYLVWLAVLNPPRSGPGLRGWINFKEAPVAYGTEPGQWSWPPRTP